MSVIDRDEITHEAAEWSHILGTLRDARDLIAHGVSSDKGDAEVATGYHGEVAIDPATGTILRVTVQADLPLGSPILQAYIMVEYGPVEIGSKTYTCPIRSVSISLDARRLSDGIGPLGSIRSNPGGRPVE